MGVAEQVESFVRQHHTFVTTFRGESLDTGLLSTRTQRRRLHQLVDRFCDGEIDGAYFHREVTTE